MSKTRNPDALIRIEDAIKVLCWETCCPGVCCPDGYCAKMWDAFEDVERVDAVPVRHGRWKGHYCEDDGIRDGWECSACGEWYYFGENKPNFCPHCGAKMDGKDGEQT